MENSFLDSKIINEYRPDFLAKYYEKKVFAVGRIRTYAHFLVFQHKGAEHVARQNYSNNHSSNSWMSCKNSWKFDPVKGGAKLKKLH